MEAKGIPDKIFLQVCGSCEQKYCDACEFEDLEDGITWSKDKIFPNDVEYIRADAFVKKAVEWLRTNWREYANVDKDGVICFGHWEGDFRKTMKG